jgi:hypothetical protein
MRKGEKIYLHLVWQNIRYTPQPDWRTAVKALFAQYFSADVLHCTKPCSNRRVVWTRLFKALLFICFGRNYCSRKPTAIEISKSMVSWRFPRWFLFTPYQTFRILSRPDSYSVRMYTIYYILGLFLGYILYTPIISSIKISDDNV